PRHDAGGSRHEAHGQLRHVPGIQRVGRLSQSSGLAVLQRGQHRHRPAAGSHQAQRSRRRRRPPQPGERTARNGKAMAGAKVTRGPGDGSMPPDTLRRKALGDFLRSARARGQPETVGLPAGQRRRAPGLRREEVAQLCDISTTWYTWIEQGREVTVSPAVLARLATVLRLQRAERHYLFDLAECADPEHDRGNGDALPAALADCVHSSTAPAYILDRSWNVMSWNAPFLYLFDGWPERDAQPNLLRYIFLDSAARTLVVDWEERASRVVAEF